MKHLFFALSISFLSIGSALGQFGINYHQSDLSFAGVSYSFTPRIAAEFRLNATVFVEDISPEFLATYRFVDRTSYAAYTGLGGRTNQFYGIMIPLGFQVSPFKELRNFALSSELALLGIGDENVILRGAIGFRYYFVRNDE
ncbi:MAG: hypothetical protein WBA23_05190 [Tunicatimonas sp.]|uniref:hypothetical protein n=1 Tax=Tunicatimonas sp. TaxID=1940096 RepID=UPI003C70D759